MNISIIMEGFPPSKKNSKQVFVKNGRMIVIPSKRHKEWHTECSQTLKIEPQGTLGIKRVEHTTCTIYSPTLRKYDLSNKWESVADLLVDMGILEDDNVDVLPVVTMIHGGKDKERPRVEIELMGCVI